MIKNTLILYAHPAQEHSEVNAEMYKKALGKKNITCVDLYAEYPHHDIDIEVEQERLRQHDIIIFLFPLYWYSTPAILKDWMDLVLEYNFAYGKEGAALKDKVLLPVISAGGAEAAYQEDGYNHFSIRELLRPLEQTAIFCKMQFIAPFVLFAARTAVEEGRLTGHLSKWEKLLNALVNNQFDLNKAKAVPHLSTQLEEIIQ